jgi:hypothetical protein
MIGDKTEMMASQIAHVLEEGTRFYIATDWLL